MFIKIKHPALMVLFLLLCFPVFANEGGEGGGEGGAKPVQKSEKTQAEEFNEKTAKLALIQTRLQDAQKDFDKIVEEKEKEKDQKRKEEMIKELVDISKSRNKDVEEYNRIRTQLLYQYPAKNAELNRLYQTEDKKDVDEMQSTADIDDLLTRIKKVIQKKFAALNPDNDKPMPSAKANPAKTGEGKADASKTDDKPVKLRLEK